MVFNERARDYDKLDWVNESKDIQKILAYISQHNTLPKNNSVVSKAF